MERMQLEAIIILCGGDPNCWQTRADLKRLIEDQSPGHFLPGERVAIDTKKAMTTDVDALGDQLWDDIADALHDLRDTVRDAVAESISHAMVASIAQRGGDPKTMKYISDALAHKVNHNSKSLEGG